jgi:putative SOS response-associated peptidase YedK
MLVYAKHRGDSEERIQALEKLLEEFSRNVKKHYHISGFTHPILWGFHMQAPYQPSVFQWGLVPQWTRNQEEAVKMARSTLNARIETLHEKASFKNLIHSNRCIIYLDAFYEYHHYRKKNYPFHVESNLDEPLAIAGLFTESIYNLVERGCTFITTSANDLMAKIHNNPKLEFGPRIPVILTKEMQDIWLDEKQDIQKLLDTISQPIDSHLLKVKSVGPLLGKNAAGDHPDAQNEMKYIELEELYSSIQ